MKEELTKLEIKDDATKLKECVELNFLIAKNYQEISDLKSAVVHYRKCCKISKEIFDFSRISDDDYFDKIGV